MKHHSSKRNVALPNPLVRKFVTPKVSDYSNKLRLGLGRCHLEQRAYCLNVNWQIQGIRSLADVIRLSVRFWWSQPQQNGSNCHRASCLQDYRAWKADKRASRLNSIDVHRSCLYRAFVEPWPCLYRMSSLSSCLHRALIVREKLARKNFEANWANLRSCKWKMHRYVKYTDEK